MNNTITKFSRQFYLGKVVALVYGAVLFGVISFFALPYLVPISDPAMRTTLGAVIGLMIGCLVAIFGGSLFKRN